VEMVSYSGMVATPMHRTSAEEENLNAEIRRLDVRASFVQIVTFVGNIHFDGTVALKRC